jgi:hypothetical protein
MDTTKTPWGKAMVLEEVLVEQQIEERDHEALVQLLELQDGGHAVRFAARRRGAGRLTCLTLRGEELEGVADALADAPRLAEVLRLSLS